MVEYLVGDGPANRFALICKQCQSHNGMALKEEFEYIAYRCCYCFYWNPARKQRPTAPKLAPGIQRQDSTSSSEDEDDVKNIPPNPQPKAISAEKPKAPEQVKPVPPAVVPSSDSDASKSEEEVAAAATKTEEATTEEVPKEEIEKKDD